MRLLNRVWKEPKERERTVALAQAKERPAIDMTDYAWPTSRNY